MITKCSTAHRTNGLIQLDVLFLLTKNVFILLITHEAVFVKLSGSLSSTSTDTKKKEAFSASIKQNIQSIQNKLYTFIHIHSCTHINQPCCT